MGSIELQNNSVTASQFIDNQQISSSSLQTEPNYNINKTEVNEGSSVNMQGASAAKRHRTKALVRCEHKD